MLLSTTPDVEVQLFVGMAHGSWLMTHDMAHGTWHIFVEILKVYHINIRVNGMGNLDMKGWEMERHVQWSMLRR